MHHKFGNLLFNVPTFLLIPYSQTFIQVFWVPLVFPFHPSSPLLLPPRTLHASWLWLWLKVPTRHCDKVPHLHTVPVKVEPPMRQMSASRGPFLLMRVLCCLLILIRSTPRCAPCLYGRLRVMTIMMMRVELLLKSLQTKHMVQSQGHHLSETLGLSLLTAQSLTLGHPILSCQLPVPLKTMSEHQAPFTRMKKQLLQHSPQNPAHPLPVKPFLLKENPQLMDDSFLLRSFSRRNPVASPSLQPNHTLSLCILNQRALHWPRYEPSSPLALKCHPSPLILLP